MRVLAAHGPDDLRVEERPRPTPDPAGVVVRVVYGGICGSDLHYARDGRNGIYTIAEPLVLGHEIVGVVDQVGSEVTDQAVVGQRVAIHPATPTPAPGGTDGVGLNLAVGGTYLGSASTTPHTQGGFAEFLAVSPAQLRPLPDDLRLSRAVLAEPLAVAIHGVARLGTTVQNARVLVSGAGPIGLLSIATLRAAGAGQIVAADLHPTPLATARAIGADATIDVSRQAPEAESFDVVIEASGSPASLSAAVDAARRGGSVLQLGILPPGPLPVALAALVSKELTLFGSQRFDVELDAAVDLLARTPSIEAAISDYFDLDRAGEAFARAADAAASHKVVIRFSEDPDA